MSFFDELQRRNVPRVAVAYLAVAWLVIQVAETLLPIFGWPETSARVLVVLLAIGFVPALAFAWLYRWTPSGWRREDDAAGTPFPAAAAHAGTRQLDRLIIVALALAVGYFAVDKFVLDPARDARIAAAAAREGRAEAEAAVVERRYAQRAIAVLPFTSSDPAQASFAEGIADQLLHTLGGLPEMRVAAPLSAFSFRDASATAREIGEALGVTHLVQGSVRAAGDSVRITARLIDAGSDAQLWSQTFDRQLADVFAIQDEIAAAVVDSLRVTLMGTIPETPRVNLEAYRLYTQATYLLRTGSQVNDEAEELLSRALELQPDYVPAILALARVYNRRSYDGDGERNRQLTRSLVNRALSIDPDDGYAHGWLSWIAITYDGDLETGAREAERALALDPTNLDLIHGTQQYARLWGQYDAAITYGRYETLRDPICARCAWQLGNSYLVAGDLDAAEDAYRAALRLDPRGDDVQPALHLGLIQVLRGDGLAAATEFERLPEGTPLRTLGAALSWHEMGRTAERDAAIDSLALLDDASRWLAPVYAWIGDRDRAFAALGENVARQLFSYSSHTIATDPVYAGLHDDPRWIAALRARGRDPQELAAIDIDLEPPPVIRETVDAGA